MRSMGPKRSRQKSSSDFRSWKSREKEGFIKFKLIGSNEDIISIDLMSELQIWIDLDEQGGESHVHWEGVTIGWLTAVSCWSNGDYSGHYFVSHKWKDQRSLGPVYPFIFIQCSCSCSFSFVHFPPFPNVLGGGKRTDLVGEEGEEGEGRKREREREEKKKKKKKKKKWREKLFFPPPSFLFLDNSFLFLFFIVLVLVGESTQGVATLSGQFFLWIAVAMDSKFNFSLAPYKTLRITQL